MPATIDMLVPAKILESHAPGAPPIGQERGAKRAAVVCLHVEVHDVATKRRFWQTPAYSDEVEHEHCGGADKAGAVHVNRNECVPAHGYAPRLQDSGKMVSVQRECSPPAYGLMTY